MSRTSTSNIEKLILLVMGIILAVSLVVLFRRDDVTPDADIDPYQIQLPDHSDETEADSQEQ